MKNLSEMSLEDLWKLFPIYLTEPQDFWVRWYEEEKNHLHQILALEEDLTIHHIGSTAIKGIWAKPIIDILIEVSTPSLLKEVKKQLVMYSYICMAERKNRISLNKGYSEKGLALKVFHVLWETMTKFIFEIT